MSGFPDVWDAFELVCHDAGCRCSQQHLDQDCDHPRRPDHIDYARLLQVLLSCHIFLGGFLVPTVSWV